MINRFVLTAVLLVLVLPAELPAAERGTVLWYLEREPGVEPYRVRYMITGDYLRSDEGEDAGGFMLFDRSDQQIYSVVPAGRSILQIDGNGTPGKAPAEIDMQVLESTEDDAPRLGGRAPLLLKLSAGGNLCRSAMVAPGYMPDAAAALSEFARALAVYQLRSLEQYPAELRTPCLLARDIYQVDFAAARGLPLAEWDDAESRRELLEVETGVELDESLFILPSDMRVIRPAATSAE